MYEQAESLLQLPDRIALKVSDSWPASAFCGASPLMFIDQPRPDRAVELTNFVENFGTGLSGQIGVEHHVADLVVGLQILREDIDVALQEHFIQAPQHAGCVAMNVAESRPERTRLQLHLRKIDGAHGRAAVNIVDHLA